MEFEAGLKRGKVFVPVLSKEEEEEERKKAEIAEKVKWVSEIVEKVKWVSEIAEKGKWVLDIWMNYHDLLFRMFDMKYCNIVLEFCLFGLFRKCAKIICVLTEVIIFCVLCFQKICKNLLCLDRSDHFLVCFQKMCKNWFVFWQNPAFPDATLFILNLPAGAGVRKNIFMLLTSRFEQSDKSSPENRFMFLENAPRHKISRHA